jgi:trehalose 6-phosphate synthase/phosphatase
MQVTLERDEKSGELHGKPSAGGLATALDSVHNKKDSTSVWVGWAGPVVAEEAELHKALDPLRLVPVIISAEEVAAYYDGFSNGVLWPLCHYLIEKISFDHSDFWAAYCTVNQRFADVIKSVYQDGDLIWIQDYQLMLVPSMLRTMIPSSTIGYFHHIPFPSSEVFRLTPARKNLVTGLLGADLVGFHTLAYGRHFFHTCDMLTEATPSTDDDVLEYDG